MNILFLLLTTIAAGIFYLSLAHQRWRHKPLPAFMRILSVVLWLLAVLCGQYSFSLGTTLFVLIAISMLLLSIFPFISLLGKNTGHDR